MSTRQATAPSPTYLSGHCGTAGHDRCRGAYAGATCRCACHRPPVCPFCAIVADPSLATVTATWRDALAIVPLNPVAPGHQLVIPRTHVPHARTARVLTGRMFAHAAEIAPAAANLITSIGRAATQTVMHLHVHVVPRADGDGLHLPWTGQLAEAGRG